MNTLKIIRTALGVAVALHIKGNTDPHDILDQPIALYEITLGAFANGAATISFPYAEDRDRHDFTFTLATHADDGEMPGRVAYLQLRDLLTHTELGHGEPAPAREPTQVEQDINAAFVSIGNIFPRLVKLEKAFAPPIIFDKWVVQGQELRLNVGGSTGDDCIIGITQGFGGLCPSRIEGQPESSQERILTIEVNGSTHLLHIFSRGDTGRIADAIASNSSVPTLGTSRPESGGESG